MIKTMALKYNSLQYFEMILVDWTVLTLCPQKYMVKSVYCTSSDYEEIHSKYISPSIIPHCFAFKKSQISISRFVFLRLDERFFFTSSVPFPVVFSYRDGGFL